MRTAKIAVSAPGFFDKLTKEIDRIAWPYVKLDVKDKLVARDKALVSLLILLGLRIGEALERKGQDFTDQPDRILVADINPEKYGLVRTELYLPKTGPLGPLTEIFEKWLKQVPSADSYVFPSAWPFGCLNWHNHLDRKRAHQIVKFTTGHFPHFYRGIGETVYGKLVFQNDIFKLKDFMGLNDIRSVFPYVAEPFRADIDRFNKIERKDA